LLPYASGGYDSQAFGPFVGDEASLKFRTEAAFQSIGFSLE